MASPLAFLRAASRGLPRLGLAAALSLALTASGCALLLPPSWRGSAPVPLAGPIEGDELDGAGDPIPLDDEALAAQVEADQQRLIALASTPGDGTEAEQAELREIADRLPRYQRELERRGRGPDLRTRHPVVR